jgi:ATP-dependent DNA helicase RecG
MLTTPINQLAGIGPAAEDALHKTGIFTLWDLLLHLPLRYEDRTQLTLAHQLHVGQLIQVEGIISRCQELPARRPVYLLTLQCNGFALNLRFLNYQNWAHTLPKVGTHIRAFGQLRADFHNQLELLHPNLIRLDSNKPTPLPNKLTAVYPSIGALKQGLLRKAIVDGLQRLQTTPPVNLLPNKTSQLSLTQALTAIHLANPGDAITLLTGSHPAIQRLALEELTAQQLLAMNARAAFANSRAFALEPKEDNCSQLIANLPFTLTKGQQQAWQDIYDDLIQAHPMHRLLQGDVGSGKTVLAALAAVHATNSGVQTSIMAPTEILAEQLHSTLSPWIEPLNIRCQLLTASSKACDKRKALVDISDGSISIVIGTHALFQEQVQYKNLGLVIVDEQHRFGVEQRLALKNKGTKNSLVPHLLLMTATPIPRTLAMSFYGDLTISNLTERPPGRQLIETVVIPDTRREAVADRLAIACQKGAQAYWVCPFIIQSETLDARNVSDTAQWLKSRYPALRVGLVHGQLSGKEKDKQMQAFKAGMLDLLVATTVIEVGVNVPNATLIIIDNSERYGLAQLHQLRGRVGRGLGKSSCVLLYKHPLSEIGHARLEAIRNSQDGFILAEQDLQLRGPGEILGTRQTGLSEWRIADLLRDTPLHQPAQALAQYIYQQHPEYIHPLIQRWQGNKLPHHTF